jgi:hypothetical protein
MPTPELGAILEKILGEMGAGIVHPRPNRGIKREKRVPWSK